MKVIEREKARELRKQGRSINQIVEEAGLTKSSVSLWVRDIILTKEQRSKISLRGRALSLLRGEELAVFQTRKGNDRL